MPNASTSTRPAPVADEPVVRLEPHEALERAIASNVESSSSQSSQSVERLIGEAEEVLDAGQGRRRRRLPRRDAEAVASRHRRARSPWARRRPGTSRCAGRSAARSAPLPARWTRTTPLSVPLRTYSRASRPSAVRCASPISASATACSSELFPQPFSPSSISHGAVAVDDASVAGRKSTSPSTLKFRTSIRSIRLVRRK